MTNYDNAHNFFYGNESRDKRYETTSYKGDYYRSYHTVIGLKTYDIVNRKPILLLSYDNFSNTISRHIKQLYNVCPYSTVKAIFNYGYYYTSPETLVNNLKNYINNAAEKLTLKANRGDFITLYKMAVTYLHLEYFNGAETEVKQTLNNIISEYTDTYNLIIENVKEFKKQLRQQEQEKRKQLKEKLKNITQKYAYYTLIQYLFIPYRNSLAENTEIEQNLKDLRTYLNPKNEFSFIALKQNIQDIVTSQHIIMSIDIIKPFLKLWKQGKLKHGMQIQQYTVRAITAQYVTIGCHKIPAKNIEAVYNAIFDKKGE